MRPVIAEVASQSWFLGPILAPFMHFYIEGLFIAWPIVGSLPIGS